MTFSKSEEETFSIRKSFLNSQGFLATFAVITLSKFFCSGLSAKVLSVVGFLSTSVAQGKAWTTLSETPAKVGQGDWYWTGDLCPGSLIACAGHLSPANIYHPWNSVLSELLGQFDLISTIGLGYFNGVPMFFSPRLEQADAVLAGSADLILAPGNHLLDLTQPFMVSLGRFGRGS
jgi:hypothetical protein